MNLCVWIIIQSSPKGNRCKIHSNSIEFNFGPIFGVVVSIDENQMRMKSNSSLFIQHSYSEHEEENRWKTEIPVKCIWFCSTNLDPKAWVELLRIEATDSRAREIRHQINWKILDFEILKVRIRLLPIIEKKQKLNIRVFQHNSHSVGEKNSNRSNFYGFLYKSISH